MRPCTQLVDGCGAGCGGLPAVESRGGFGIGEIGLGGAHQEEVGIGELRVVARRTVGLPVIELRYGETSREHTYLCGVGLIEVAVAAIALLTVEERAVVAGCGRHIFSVHVRHGARGEELFDQILACAVACPCLGDVVAGGSILIDHDAAVKGAGHEEQRRAIGSGGLAVLQHGQDGFYRCAALAVVAHEELLIGGPAIGGSPCVEVIGRVHDALRIVGCLLPLRGARVDLGVEV